MKFKVLLTLASCAFLGNFAKATVVNIRGWPLTVHKHNPLDSSWAHDPILGVLACPTLTQLDLINKRSYSPVLESVTTQKNPKSGKTQWVFTLPKAGPYWWDGKAVTTLELSQYIEASLSQIGRDNLRHWPTQDPFSVTTNDRSAVVTWTAAPTIGPYIFNEVPFSKTENGELACIGPYRVQIETWGVELTAIKPKTLTYDKIRVFDAATPLKSYPEADQTFTLRFPHYEKLQVANRHPDKPMDCERTIDFPIFTGIVWQNLPKTEDNSQFRKAMTLAIPRGALLRSGAAYLGDLVTAPLIVAHPGYDNRLKIRPYSLEMSESYLEKLGFRRSEKHGPLLDKNGKPLIITLASPNSSNQLVNKAIKDSLAKVGIEVHFTTKTADATGLVASFHSPWPSGSLSEIVEHFEIDKESAKLAALSREYDRSLTFASPNFAILQKIHQHIYQLEPITTFIQHRACLISTPQANLKPIIVRNPDWFKSIANL